MHGWDGRTCHRLPIDAIPSVVDGCGPGPTLVGAALIHLGPESLGDRFPWDHDDPASWYACCTERARVWTVEAMSRVVRSASWAISWAVAARRYASRSAWISVSIPGFPLRHSGPAADRTGAVGRVGGSYAGPLEQDLRLGAGVPPFREALLGLRQIGDKLTELGLDLGRGEVAHEIGLASMLPARCPSSQPVA